MKYKRGDWAERGNYSYYLVDFWTFGSSPPTTFRSKLSQVRVITQDRLLTIDAPEGEASCTHDPDPALPPSSRQRGLDALAEPPSKRGKFWLVFQQNALTGVITVPPASEALRCFGQDSNTGHGTELPYPLGDKGVTYD
jgi:hypothetical protein